jgi:putative nucleotidyltransferase with HDIG domain
MWRRCMLVDVDSRPTAARYRRMVPPERDLVSWAEGIAREALAGVDDRLRHTAGVACRAAEAAHILPEADRPVLIAAAWLHDVGYAPEAQDTGLHALDGARYLQRLDASARVVNLVAHHSGARYEAAVRGIRDLDEFMFEDSPIMNVLVWADMTVGPRGDVLSPQSRVAEIFMRYPDDHPVHQAVADAETYLTFCVAETHSRLQL